MHTKMYSVNRSEFEKFGADDIRTLKFGTGDIRTFNRAFKFVFNVGLMSFQ